MKILQINTTVNSGSTGRIAEEIGKLLISQGHVSYVAYGRGKRPSDSYIIKIGNKLNQAFHVVNTRLFDRHGLSSTMATKKLLEDIEEIRPEVIHLHNLHGYYINFEILFKYLKDIGKPIVWTLHDCWAFTGHCTYFDRINCYKWQTECNNCPLKTYYPASYFLDNSTNNYKKKKTQFNILLNMVIVTPSKWLAKHIEYSFLNQYKVKIIHNGVDLNLLSDKNFNSKVLKKYELDKKKYILGVAGIWDRRKGYEDFISLRQKLSRNIEIVLVGLNRKLLRYLPDGITGITRTENVQELATLYSFSQAFINPTYVDNLPTTNLEALACGIPVVTYDSGGCSETIDNETGILIEKGNVESLALAIVKILSIGKEYYSEKCRERAIKYFNKDVKFQEYINLYEQLIRNS